LSAIVAASIGADVERLTGGSIYGEWQRAGGQRGSRWRWRRSLRSAPRRWTSFYRVSCGSGPERRVV